MSPEFPGARIAAVIGLGAGEAALRWIKERHGSEVWRDQNTTARIGAARATGAALSLSVDVGTIGMIRRHRVHLEPARHVLR